MNLNEVLALYDQDQRVNLTYPDMRKEVQPYIIRFIRPAPGSSYVSFSRMDAANADTVIEEQIQYFKQNGLRLVWKCYQHDQPADLKQRLLDHHFMADESGTGDVMVMDLRETPPELLKPASADIRQIKNRRDIKDVIRVMEQVWGGNFNWMEKRMGGHLEVPGYLSLYVVYAQRKPVSAAWTYYAPNCQFASLWGGSTIESARKQGFYTQLLAVRVQEALRRGMRYVYVEAGAMSRPIVEKHGFQYLTCEEDFEWQAE